MKRSRLIQIIKEEIQHVLREESNLRFKISLFYAKNSSTGKYVILGRVYNYFSFWRLKDITKKEYYYHMSCEHVNSIQNLINIVKYNFLNYSFYQFDQIFKGFHNILLIKYCTLFIMT